MQLKITLSANAGISLQAMGHKILVDALHKQRASVFSPLSPEMIDKIFLHPDFENPDAILYTHCHDDHFSERLTAEFVREYPEAKLVLPERRFMNQVLLKDERHTVFVGDIELDFIRMTHEGEEFVNVPHYVIILSFEGKRVLISGDCKVASRELLDVCKGRQIDLAIVDFPWVTLSRGRHFLLEELKPRRILVNHVPFESEDAQGFRPVVEKARGFFNCDFRILQDAFASEEYNL